MARQSKHAPSCLSPPRRPGGAPVTYGGLRDARLKLSTFRLPAANAAGTAAETRRSCSRARRTGQLDDLSPARPAPADCHRDASR
jgi:hypothetical protein